jgi:superfamily II DNA or RNA helicase
MEAFRSREYNTEVIVSDTTVCPNRQELNHKFKNGQIQILINVDILTEGWDYPDLGCVGAARSTQSLAVYMQQIGRGTRLKSEKFINKHDKNNCIILDFVDNVGKHKLINCWELEKDKPIEERVLMSKEKKANLLAVKQAREIELKSRVLRDQNVDLLALPKVKYCTSWKMQEDATERQIELLQKLGVSQDGVKYTKLQASEAISEAPASERQVYMLRKNGYDTSNGVTIGQAQLAFEELISKGKIKDSKPKKEVKPFILTTKTTEEPF